MARALAPLTLVAATLVAPRGQAWSAEAPTHLFVIERSLNANTVVYDAVTAGAGRLDARAPLRAYWIMRASRGQVSRLNALEWASAYGYDVRSCDGGSCTVALRALANRPILVEFADGAPRAVTSICASRAVLHRVFVTVERGGLFPTVSAVELFGESLDTAMPLYERLAVR